MSIEFLVRGKGSAAAAVDYLLGERDSAGQLRARVEVLRGDPAMVAADADSVGFEGKYTSAVITWRSDDRPTDAQIESRPRRVREDGLGLPLPQNFSLDFTKPLRYGGRHGDSELGLPYSTGQPRPPARRAGRGGVAGRRQPRAGRRPRL